MKSDTSDTSETGHDSASVTPGRTPIEPSRRDAVEDWLTLFVRMLGLPASETEAVRDELEDHLRSRVDDLLITGVSEPEAVRRAVAELGETAKLAQGFRNARRTPRRRTAMYALFAIAGSALLLSSTALYNGSAPAPLRVIDLTQPEVVAIEGKAAETAPFNENLRRYDISGMVPDMQRLAYMSGGIPAFQSNESSLEKRVATVTDTIQRLVDSERWEMNGGDEAKIHTIGSMLFVDAPADMHEGVVWVLQSLRQDVQRAEAEARRQTETVLRDRDARENEQRMREERLRAESEAKLEKDVAELENAYRDLTEQIVKHEEDKTLLEIQKRELELSQPADVTSGEADKQLAQIRGRLVRLEIEQETAQTRMAATRDLLTALQFQKYAAFAPAAPGGATSAPAGRQNPFTGEVTPAAPSGRSGR